MTTLVMTTPDIQYVPQLMDTDDTTEAAKPKRKRQRLDHLSQEEKLMRRKLKNRMAAQSARDRKKVKLNDLEDEVNVLIKQKKALVLRNAKLIESNKTLEQQNRELKQKLGLLLSKTVIKEESVDINDWKEIIESAELISDPQQKEQVSHPVIQSLIILPLMTLFVFWLITKNPKLCSMFFTRIQKNCSTTIQIQNSNPMYKQMKAYQITNRHHIWDQLKT
ncbi:X-box-binding protein 1-like [Oppia nitens]|uniref:X-box-binding protein 1-like n=1 Tax=Oppia nitens TaxID=1686743 RepID=UPI0023DCD8D0|nr:X-box-binding protein 1-like [Oppia nitens]